MFWFSLWDSTFGLSTAIRLRSNVNLTIKILEVIENGRKVTIEYAYKFTVMFVEGPISYTIFRVVEGPLLQHLNFNKILNI